MSVGVTVPEERNNTFDPSEVHRKNAEEKINSAFNEDQKAILDDLINNAPSAGLPAVTVEDDGDVLTVVEGEWVNASSALVIHVTEFEPSENPTPMLLDVTGEDLHAALVAGRSVIFSFAMPAMNSTWTELSNSIYLQAVPTSWEDPTLEYYLSVGTYNGSFVFSSVSDFPLFHNIDYDPSETYDSLE